jgi:hypothetical protein
MPDNQRKEDIYKSNDSSVDQSYATLKKEVAEIKSRAQAVAEKLNDPMFQAALMHAIVHEKEDTNRILKSIYAELEKARGLEERVARLEEGMGKAKTTDAIPLPEADARIIAFLREKGKACAEEVQKKLGYKGKNGASARLNRLYMLGAVSKAQVGRKVLYFAK